jgi:hypothetical protein
MDRTIRSSNPKIWGEIFHTRPERPWGLPSYLYNWYWVIQGVKRLGCGVNHPNPSSAKAKVRVELYLYSPSCVFMAGYRLKFNFLIYISVKE